MVLAIYLGTRRRLFFIQKALFMAGRHQKNANFLKKLRNGKWVIAWLDAPDVD